MRQICEGKCSDSLHDRECSHKDTKVHQVLVTFVPFVRCLRWRRDEKLRAKISMLHVFGGVAKTARAAIPRYEFLRAHDRSGIPRTNLYCD